MKLFRCKKMGEISNLQCYDCFSNGLGQENFESRVICKKNNIVEELTLQPASEPSVAQMAEMA